MEPFQLISTLEAMGFAVRLHPKSKKVGLSMSGLHREWNFALNNRCLVEALNLAKQCGDEQYQQARQALKTALESHQPEAK